MRLSWWSSGALVGLFACAGAGCFALDGCLFDTTGGGAGGGGAAAGGGGAGGTGAGGTGGGGGGTGGATGWISGIPEDDGGLRVRYLDLALGTGELIVAGAIESDGPASVALGGACSVQAGNGLRPFIAFFDLEGNCLEAIANVEWSAPALEGLTMAVAKGKDPGEAYLVFSIANVSKLIHVVSHTANVILVDCSSGYCRFNDVVFDGEETAFAVGGIVPGGDPCSDGMTAPALHKAFAVSLRATGRFPSDVDCAQQDLSGSLGTPGKVDHFLGRAAALPNRLVFSGYSAGTIGDGNEPCTGACLFYGVYGTAAGFEAASGLDLQPSASCALPAVAAEGSSAWSLATSCEDANFIVMPSLFSLMGASSFNLVDQVTPSDAKATADWVVGAGGARSLGAGHGSSVRWGFLALEKSGNEGAPDLYYLIPNGATSSTEGTAITGIAPTSDQALYFVGHFDASVVPSTLELERFADSPANREIVLGPLELPACSSEPCTRPFIGRWQLPAPP
ncbi:MAG: hypothetical protein IPM79_36595 [Polyangiaceae bacterium]|nr:hypothetical protein [Polyangiaceae bacterium]MBK8942974.1 hypothetical protein [Polyangiaceae bacterium]